MTTGIGIAGTNSSDNTGIYVSSGSFLSMASSYTVAFWLWGADLTPAATGLAMRIRTSTGFADQDYVQVLPGGGIQFISRVGGVSSTINGPTLVDGNDYHVAVVRSATSMSLYIDGALHTSISATDCTSKGATTSESFGSSSASGDVLVSDLANIKAWQQALGSTQIATEMDALGMVETGSDHLDLRFASGALTNSAPTSTTAMSRFVAGSAGTHDFPFPSSTTETAEPSHLVCTTSAFAPGVSVGPATRGRTALSISLGIHL